MQKTFIIFAVILLSSSALAQLEMREYQTITDDPSNAARTESTVPGEAICNLAISYLQNGERNAAYEQLKTLEKINSGLAALLRDAIWSKFVVDASKIKPED